MGPLSSCFDLIVFAMLWFVFKLGPADAAKSYDIPQTIMVLLMVILYLKLLFLECLILLGLIGKISNNAPNILKLSSINLPMSLPHHNAVFR